MSDGWTYEYSFPVPGDRDRLFGALTTEEELEAWFAEHVRIDPGEGGRFEFWGRHTVGTPGEGEAGGLITAYRPGERLAFEWELFGAPSTVTIALAPEATEDGPATRVAIEHAFDRVFDGPRPKELVDDWWRFNLGNLTAHATGRGEVMRVDFADESPEIRLSLHMEAAPEKVWRALTEPEGLNRWIAKDAKVDLREGGRWDLGFTPDGSADHEGPAMEILELVPNRKLVVSWPDWRADASVPSQSVTWHLEPDGTGTRVTLIHSGFVRAVDLSDYPFGWDHFLRRMRGVVEDA